MPPRIEQLPDTLDPAAVFAGAFSLWESITDQAAADPKLNLSDCYNGMDQLMREVMRIANQFEAWSCAHVEFDQLNDVWPYLLQDRFGAACLTVLLPTALASFDDCDCLRVALQLRLPVRLEDGLPVPVDVWIENPIKESPFRQFRIQTVRNHLEDHWVEPYTADDEQFDPEYSEPYFGLYGVEEEGRLEHIADRANYGDAVSLVEKLAPGATENIERSTSNIER
jgi:hypothetical protein